MTPTRDELAAMIQQAWRDPIHDRDALWHLDHRSHHRAADVVLPLLAERDTENERLRTDAAADRDAVDFHLGELRAEANRMVAERDAALAEVERLRGLVECSGDHTDLIAEIERLRVALYGERDEFVILAPEDFKTLVAERDAALAENERLRDHVMVEMAEQIREARRIAQQLAYAIVNSWSNQSPLKAALERGWQ